MMTLTELWQADLSASPVCATVSMMDWDNVADAVPPSAELDTPREDPFCARFEAGFSTGEEALLHLVQVWTGWVCFLFIRVHRHGGGGLGTGNWDRYGDPYKWLCSTCLWPLKCVLSLLRCVLSSSVVIYKLYTGRWWQVAILIW